MAANAGDAARINDVVRHFKIEVCQFTEARLVLCETEPIFEQEYETWKARLGLRCVYLSVKRALIAEGFAQVHRRRIILLAQSRGEARRLALDELLGPLVDKPHLLENKGGITISCFPNTLDLLAMGVERNFACTIKSGGAGGVLTKISPISVNFKYATSTGGVNRAVTFPLKLRPDETLNLVVTFKADFPAGVVRSMIIFEFFSGTLFTVGRELAVNVGDAVVHELLKPVAPYVRRRRDYSRSQTKPEYVDGERPAGDDQNDDKFTPPQQFKIPQGWLALCKLNQASDQLLQMRDQLGVKNMKELYHKLLWTEELQLDKEIERYDMENTSLEVRGAFLALRVPGLAEKRPSVQKGDKVIAIYPHEARRKFVGYVHRIELDCALLKFNKAFHQGYVTRKPVNIEFTYSRMQLRVCHQGVENLTPDMMKYLTPPAAGVAPPVAAVGAPAAQPVALHPMDRRLNEEQLRAVRNVVQHSHRDIGCPYIIFGPPGTGKSISFVLQYPSYTSEPFLICICMLFI